jgi:STE24 endopeptidase
MNPSMNMTLAFALALVLNLIVKIGLMTRQNKCVLSNRAQVPKAFESTITLAAHQKAADYTLAKSKIAFWDLFLETLVIVGWTLLGGINWLNQALVSWLGLGLIEETVFILAFVFISGLINLPLSWIQTFVVEERFGFNKLTVKLWITDMIKGVALGLVLGVPLIALILWLMDAGGANWWLKAWGAMVAFQLLMIWIAPTFLMPLFNKFTPLNDDTLKERIASLMERSGFKAKGFFVMDGSKRSAHSNAFFTGFGNSKRVVFFDTLLEQLSADEMEAVLAHELGHFKHKHLLKMIAINFCLSLLGFAILGYLSQQAWFFTGLGVTPNFQGFTPSGNNALALILFTLVTPLVTFMSTPISSWRSRVQEFEADAYATSHTPAEHLESALTKLYKDNASTLTPDPWYAAFYYSHPPATERLARMRA